MTDLEALADTARTREIYERHAEAFDRHRHRHLIERPWLDRALALAPPGTPALDLGCGAGEPIARYLHETGRELVGIDLAENMLSIARQRLASATFVRMDMQRLELDRTFGLIVAWDSFFHLTPNAQRATLPRMVAHLAPGGALLFTCGHQAGEVTGTVEGDTVYHASLDPVAYRTLLAEHGVDVVDFVAEDPDCDHHSIVLAQRRQAMA